MPSISACVAWAVPVHPVELGAHFEAYIKLQPTIQTLRLCNRFGKGEKVTITRLPMELIDAIEDCLMQKERKKQRKEWTRDFRCWQSDCTIFNHFTSTQLADLWHDYVGCDEGGVANCKHVRNGLSKKQGDKLEFRMYDCDDGSEDWRKPHWKQRDAWWKKVQDVIVEQSSKDSFLKLFGLDMWISHSVRSLTEQFRRFEEENESTLTYLVLPNAGGLGVDFERLEHGGGIRSGHGVILAQPTRPSEASMKRFPRAMKLLGLTPTALHISSKGVEEGQQSVKPEGAGNSEIQTNYTDPSSPQLRLLVSSTIEPCH